MALPPRCIEKISIVDHFLPLGRPAGREAPVLGRPFGRGGRVHHDV